MSTTNVFISYRRDDSKGHAGRLFDGLRLRFGDNNVFMDVTTIRAGASFVESIDRALANCDAFVVVVGPHWLSATDHTGRRRLDDSEDYVRTELSRALKCGTRIFPVLVDGARMPAAASLPPDLREFAMKQAIELGEGTAWDPAVRTLVNAVLSIVPNKPGADLLPPPRSVGSAFFLVFAWVFAFVYPAFFALEIWAGDGFESALNWALASGAVFGSIAGAVGAIFLRGLTMTVPFSSRDTFDARLTAVVSERHLKPVTATENFLSYRGRFRFQLMGEKLFIRVDEGSATFVGPAPYVWMMRHQFGS